MSIFFIVLTTMLPVFVSISIGYWAGKRLGVEGTSVAPLLFYIFSPIVMFSGPATGKVNMENISLPILMFAICCLISIVMYRYMRGKRNDDGTANIIAMSAGCTNVGYVGLPVAMALFNEQTVGIYIMTIMGVNFYENSLGYFIASRGTKSWTESIKHIATLPSLYAFALGCVIGLLNINITGGILTYIQNMRGCYAILGIMQVGIALSRLESLDIDWQFLRMILIPKFILWPAIVVLLILLDITIFHFYDRTIYEIFILMSCVPVGGNTIAIATILKMSPEKIATAVMFSLIIALLIMPIIISLTSMFLLS